MCYLSFTILSQNFLEVCQCSKHWFGLLLIEGDLLCLGRCRAVIKLQFLRLVRELLTVHNVQMWLLQPQWLKAAGANLIIWMSYVTYHVNCEFTFTMAQFWWCVDRLLVYSWKCRNLKPWQCILKDGIFKNLGPIQSPFTKYHTNY